MSMCIYQARSLLFNNKMYKQCITEGCCNDVRPSTRYCYSCLQRHYKEKHPLRYCYNTLRSNAKRRYKGFGITFAEFEQFCKDTGYIEGKGKTKTSLSIDRIYNFQGYDFTNMRVLTLSANSKKGIYDDVPF